jgi:hypothetical protein
VPKRRHHGHGSPRTEGYLANQPLTPWTTTAAPGHRQRQRGLIDENQPFRIQFTLPAPPSTACDGDVRTVLLGRVQYFF